MVKSFNIKSAINFMLIGVFAAFLTSCDDAAVDHSDYIPKNACAVITVNSDKIIDDAMFSLISNSDIMEGLVSGPLASFSEDPGAVGVERFTQYYMFATGTNFMDAKMGVILPLSDGDKLGEFLKENYEVEIEQDSIYNVANVSSEHKVVWDNHTAIYYFGGFGGDLVNEAIDLFVQNKEDALAAQDSTFQVSLVEKSHITAWFKNDDFANMIDFGMGMQSGIKPFEMLNINKEDLKDARSIFAANFQEGSLEITSKQYLNDVQKKIYQDLGKPNDIAKLTNLAGTENPVTLISASLKSEGLLELMKEYKVDETWNQLTETAPVKLSLEQVVKFFGGDVLVTVNGFDEFTKNVPKPVMNDEGEYETMPVEVKHKIPQMTIGLSLANENQFKMFGGMIFGQLPQENGVYNWQNEVFFTIKNGNLYLATTSKGKDIITNLNGKLNPALNEVVTTHRTSAYINLQENLDFASQYGGVPGSLFKAGSKHLKDVLMSEKGLNESGVLVGSTKVNFISNEHSLISSMKLLHDIVPAMMQAAGDFL